MLTLFDVLRLPDTYVHSIDGNTIDSLTESFAEAEDLAGRDRNVFIFEPMDSTIPPYIFYADELVIPKENTNHVFLIENVFGKQLEVQFHTSTPITQAMLMCLL